jgi:DNA-binding NarL/FixJ family response regulator
MIEVVVAAYASGSRGHQRWLRHVVEAARPHFDHGLGVWGFLIDARRRVDEWAGPLISLNVPRGFPSAMREFLSHGFARMPLRLLEVAFRRPAPRVAAGSELAGGQPLTSFPMIAPLARQFAFDDSIGVRCGDPRGLGCFVGAFTPEVFRTSPASRRRWSRVAAHVTAATFTDNGRLLYVGPRAEEHVAHLRAAVVNRARARSHRLSARPDEALELWPALVAGRWSLVDGERGTCRALWNAPASHANVAISRLERDVSSLVAMGHTNKLVAYELGIAEGTVSAVVDRLRKKLGAASRATLVAACARLEDDAGSGQETPLLALLSPGEREVVRAAAEGFSNAAIAASRGHSVRTTENMLAVAYRKLGVRSRAELVARLLG